MTNLPDRRLAKYLHARCTERDPDVQQLLEIMINERKQELKLEALVTFKPVAED